MNQYVIEIIRCLLNDYNLIATPSLIGLKDSNKKRNTLNFISMFLIFIANTKCREINHTLLKAFDKSNI